MTNYVGSALPILRQLGAQSTSEMLKHGVDFSMLKVWAGLEARSWLQASIEDVSSSFCSSTARASMDGASWPNSEFSVKNESFAVWLSCGFRLASYMVAA